MDRERRLRLALWYPSRETLPQGISYVGAPREAVFAEVAPAHAEPLPVLVFSHGSGGFAEQSYSMMEFFASHGWVVAAPDHTGNTFLDVRSGISPETLETRPQDISAVIDFLQALPAEDPLAALISDDIVVSGHSFGGYTTLALSGAAYDVETFLDLCERGGAGLGAFCDYLTQPEVVARFRASFFDPRIKLGIPMAPFGGIVFGEGAGAIDVPILLMTARADQTLPPAQDGDPLWEGLDGEEDVRLDFVTGGHFTFSNGCALAETLGFGLGNDDGCGPNFIGVDQAFYVINAYALAFARFHLWGDATDQDLLRGERTLDATVQVFTGP
jgi:predicted dienelactone hydrolase